MMRSIDRIELGSDVTIGMTAYGNMATTQQALNALFSSVSGDFQLILVDDCSPDDTRSLFSGVKSLHPNTEVFSFDANLEYSGSLNAVLSHSLGRYTLFISNDIFVTPAYVRELFRVAGSDKRHGIVRGCSNFVDNLLPSHNIPMPEGAQDWSTLVAFSEGIAAEHGGEVLYDRYLTGDAFLVRREVIDKIGVLDPLFYGYFADHDYGIRARIAGFQLALAKGAYAYHMRHANFEYLPKDVRKAKLSARWERVYENWARFKMKYGLPVEMARVGMNKLDWDRFCGGQFGADKHYVRPEDYSKYLLP
jgi:hypothetical protein